MRIPLELIVEPITYGEECGNSLPRDAARSVQFPIRGVSSPEDGKSGVAATPAPLSAPTPSPDSGRVVGGGVYRIGGGVSAPTVIFRVDAEYSEEARKAKWQGTVVLSLVVDERGFPREIKVVRALGLGLDQKAIEAVQKWRFKPSMKDGKPAAVQATIELNFRLP